MDALEKAAIRIAHWLEHNESHLREYEKFAAQLEEAEAGASAAQIREMIELTRSSHRCLEKALAALGDAPRGRGA